MSTPTLRTLGDLFYSDDGEQKTPGPAIGEQLLVELGLVRLLSVALSAPQDSFTTIPLKMMYRHLRKQGLDPIAYRVVHLVNEEADPVEIQSVYTFYGPTYPRQ